MSKSAALQKARSRSRSRRQVTPAKAPPRRFARLIAESVCAQAALDDVSQLEDDAPFDAPDTLDDAFAEIEEETIFAAHDREFLGDEVVATETVGFADEPPPFDPPDDSDEIFQVRRIEHDDEPLLLVEAARDIAPAHKPPPARADAPNDEQPAPPIAIYASWDRPEIGAMFDALASNPLTARTRLSVERGGLDAAIAHSEAGAAPALFVIDTNLAAPAVLHGLDRLAPAIARGAKVIVLSDVNDIRLMRGLAARGVSDYIVSPASQDDLARAICRLFADTDASRVIAIIGARGGVGASTIAHNIAWSMAERHGAETALVNLDLCFGASSFSIAAPPEPDSELTLQRIASPHSERLHLFAAPPALDRDANVDPEIVRRMIARARRESPYVVLDVPHDWSDWVEQTLLAADEVMIVARPDLASLCAAKNILERLRGKRANPPVVALSMTGVPKRPEIVFKDFAETIASAPVATFAFEPELHGRCAIEGKMLSQAAPGSKAAITIDQLASALSGLELTKAPSPIPSTARAPSPKAPAPKLEPKAAEAPAPVKANTPPDTTSALKRLKAARATAPSEEAPAKAEPAAAQDPEAFLRKAQEAALAELKAAPPPPTPQRKPSALLVTAASVCAFTLLGAWHTQNRAIPAQAAEAPVEAPAPIAPVDDRPARYESALQTLGAGDVDQGIGALRRVAEDGYAPAQYRLAKLYERGEGAPADLIAARDWTERAAGAGHVRAMHDLGVYFSSGEGGPQDHAAAFRWFRQAAEFGVADSQFNLGVLYQQGRGVSANAAEALFWFTLAAREGNPEAAARATAIEPDVSPMYVEQARARAAAFRPRAPNPASNESAPG